MLAWFFFYKKKTAYDIRRLVCNICLSDAYQLESKWSGNNKPQPDLFACGLEKPLRAEVLLQSILVALGIRPDATGQLAGFDQMAGVLADRFPDVQAPESMPNLRQGLFLSNNSKFNELLKTRPANRELSKISGPRDQVDAAFVPVLGRLPDRAEKQQSLQFVGRRVTDRERALRQLFWALLTSAEFQFNH